MSDKAKANGKANGKHKAKNPYKGRKPFVTRALKALDKAAPEIRAQRTTSLDKAAKAAGVSPVYMRAAERRIPRSLAGILTYAKGAGLPVSLTVGKVKVDLL